MAKRKVPSQAASGAETFNDFLVGRQITDGTSSLTNTVFSLDKVIPQRDSKSFSTTPFSEFLTLDSIKQVDGIQTTTRTKTKKTNEVSFKSNKKYADKSLFGSLSSRILVSLTRIINKFPGAINIVADSPISSSPYSVSGSTYDDSAHTTIFYTERSKFFNPFDLVLIEPNSVIKPETENELRNFYSSYTKYVIVVNNVTYPILEYTEPNVDNVIQFKVYGQPFTGSTYLGNVLIRPNDGLIEEFFSGLDDLEQSLLNRETNPIYTSSFRVPRDSQNNSKTSLVSVTTSWPLSNDGYNIQITGIDYELYVTRLSDIANEIDDYKSNLMVRFLSSPQLFEFDTEDKRAESVFQLYGQSFDSVKKYIDNIAYMRNVSYDSINNLPDVLLKNLSENLGLSTTNLFDEKKLEDVLYTRINTTYAGISTGTNLVEAEYEFYRRLLVNLIEIYKSKGTRKALEFFLKFLGAPEPLIKINEYIYQVTSLPASFDLEEDIYEAIQGNKTYTFAVLNVTGYTYEKKTYTGTTSFDRDGYPVNEINGLPRRAYSETEDVFFEKGAGWYDITLSHRSPLILDTTNSVLTGRTKTIITKNKPYTYGEDYFNVFRTLPGLDTGYDLVSDIDNTKARLKEDNSDLILNRKNIEIYISPARAIDYDVFRRSKELEISFGTNNNLPTQTGKTFVEFLDTFIHNLVKNSNKIRYKKNYIQLEDVYRDYLSQTTGFTPYHQITVTEFVDKISPYWVQLIEQLVPASTLWTGGNLIENNVFGRPKYPYVYDCQPLQFIEELYPDFETYIEEDLENILGEEINFRSLLRLTGVTFYPIIEIDGVIYGGADYSGLTSNMYVVLSGTTNTSNSAKLFDLQPLTGCTSGVTSNDPINLSLICDYKDYLEPDVDKIKELWLDALSELISDITITRNSAGYEPYSPFTGTTGQTYYSETIPLIKWETFTDVNGVEKVRFSSVKLGPNDCSVSEYFDYRFETDYSVNKNSNLMSAHVYGDGTVYCETPTGCTLVSDLFIELIGYKTGVQEGTDWSFYFYANCISGTNENADVHIEKVSDCIYKLTGVSENDVINFNVIDSANKEVKFKILGLQPKFEHDPCPEPSGKTHTEIFEIVSYQGTSGNPISSYSEVVFCDNYTGYTIQPKLEYKTNFDYGLKCDSIALKIDNSLTIDDSTTYQDVQSFISGGTITKVNVCNLSVGDYILSAEVRPCTTYSHQNILDGMMSGFSFTYGYRKVQITSIECLGSVRSNLITGLTQNNDYEVFEVLPTTQLRVYTNKSVENFGVPENGRYFFDFRFPEELQIKPSDFIEPCCNHPKELYNHGDYLINQYGFPIEVIDVDLDYCNPNLYFNLNLETDCGPYNDTLLVVFNGNVDEQLLLGHKYENHPGLGFDLGQYYVDDEWCPDVPTDFELLNDVFCPSPPPTPSITPTPTKTPSITPTLTKTPSTTPTPTKTPSVTPSVTPTSSLTPQSTPSTTPSVTPTSSLTPSVTPSRTPSTTPSVTPTSSLTPQSTPSTTPSVTSTSSVTPSVTPSRTPSVTPTSSLTPSVTPSRTPSVTPSVTPTSSLTPQSTPSTTPSVTSTSSVTPSVTPSRTPSVTSTSSVTPSVTPSRTPSVTPSVTPTSSLTPQSTPSTTPSVTSTSSVTPSVTPSRTPSVTSTSSVTPSVTPSRTPSVTSTSSVTPSVTPSRTPSVTPSVTPTNSLTPSVTPSITPTNSLTPSLTPTNSLTPSLTPTPSCPPCYFYLIEGTGGNEVSYIQCNGTLSAFSVSNGSSDTICARPGTITFYPSPNPAPNVTQQSQCGNQC
jgi:hypothetical protein